MSEIKREITLGELLRGMRRTSRNPRALFRGLGLLIKNKPGRPMSIGRMLRKQAAIHADRVAMRDAHRSYTYAEFNARANRIASLLRDCGVGRGDGVALMMENRVDLLLAAAGVVKLGAVGIMLNHNQRGDVLAHSLKITNPKAMIIGSECAEGLDTVREQLPDTLGEGRFWLADYDNQTPVEGFRNLEEALTNASDAEPPETDELTTSDGAFYVFTSGTTGMPKAAVMSHGRWLKALAGVGLTSLRMSPEDVFYCPLPLYHNNALTLSWSACMGSGATLAIARKFSASRFWDDIHHYNATAFVYIGELCRYLLNQPESEKERTHRIRVVLGNGLRPELWTEFRQRFKIPHINEFYGASECNLLFTNTYDQEQSCGFTPYAYAIVEYDTETEEPIRDEQGRLRKVGRGEVGLLLSKVSKFAPYDGYTSKDASEKKLLKDAFKNGDCWFNTGDLVRDMGLKHIQFVDRLGDTFRWKGENVATTEVEQAVNSFEGIIESVVYGVEIPGAEGRAGMAAVTLDDGAEFDPEGLARHLNERLPGYAIPLYIRTRTGQETTSTFKYQKTKLKKEAYDPKVVPDPLYQLSEDGQRYEPMNGNQG